MEEGELGKGGKLKGKMMIGDEDEREVKERQKGVELNGKDENKKGRKQNRRKKKDREKRRQIRR